MARRLARRGLGALFAVVLSGAVLGWMGTPWIASRLAPPRLLDPAVWTVLVPGRHEGVAGSDTAAGTAVVDGMLLMSSRAFGRVDIVTPKDARPVGALELEIAPESGTFFLNVHESDGELGRPVQLGPEAWRAGPRGEWLPYAAPGPIRVEFRDGFAWVQGARADATGLGTVELTPTDRTIALTAIHFYDADGSVILTERFDGAAPGASFRVASSVAGAGAALLAAGTFLGASSRALGVVGVAVCLVPPLLTLRVPFTTWRELGERLYLVGTSAGDLRHAAVAASLAPLLAAGLLGLGAVDLVRMRGREPPAVAVLAFLGAIAAVASREGAGLWALPGFAFLALPWWTARRAGLPVVPVLLRDSPALAVIAAFGWGPALLPAAFWRLLCLWRDIPTLLEIQPRAGADAAFLLALAVPVGIESAVRSSYLDEVWSPATLEGEVATAEQFDLFWEGRCGAGPFRTIYAFGGSSAGGAYQFDGEPESFFPAQVHLRLCASGASVHTRNFANGGRSTFEIAQAAPGLFASAPPALALVYTGVNDLLAEDDTMSRKDAAAKRASVAPALAGLDRLASGTRSLTGLALLMRPTDGDAARVAAVPLPDAEENLRAIATATTARGGTLVLVTEYTQPTVRAKLEPYKELEMRLAAELPGVAFIDLPPLLRDDPTDFIDANHLSRSGSARVAEVLAPALAAILASPGRE